MRVETGWHKVVEAAGPPERTELVYVLGGIDTGKTTFCSYLHQRVSPAALIDWDPGQSVIGPPATIGASLADGMRCLGFVGSTSPQGHLLQTVCGIRKLVDWSLQQGMRKVVLDSCGFVAGKGAHEFQFQVIDLVRPTHIVAIQRELELEELLSNFAMSTIHRLAVSSAVSPRTIAQRQEYRRQRFRQYFQGAQACALNLNGLGIHGMVPEDFDLRTCRNVLVALCGQDAFVLVLGIIEEIDSEKGTMALFSPPFDVRQVRSIQLGSIRLDRSGREWSEKLVRDHS